MDRGIATPGRLEYDEPRRLGRETEAVWAFPPRIKESSLALKASTEKVQTPLFPVSRLKGAYEKELGGGITCVRYSGPKGMSSDSGLVAEFAWAPIRRPLGYEGQDIGAERADKILRRTNTSP
jgi:hypothetical protein